MPKLITIKPLSEQTGIPVRTLRSLVAKKKISCVRAGYRTVFFDPDKVCADLGKLEVRAVA